jgi:hypothetical protein
MSMTKKVGLIWLVLCAMALPVMAQPQETVNVSDTLSANGDSFVVNVRGMASLRLQTKDSYSGTWEVQCSADGGTTYDTDDELNLSLEGASDAAVQAVTDAVGIWTANVAGCTHIKVLATAGFAASDTVVVASAIISGGSSGGGGGSSVTAVGTLTNDNAAATSNRIATLPVITETSAPTRTNGRDAALSGTAGGSIRVMIADAAGAAVTVASDGTFDSALPATGPAVGVRAETTTPTDVSDGDQVSPMADVDGQLFTIQSATSNPLSGGTDCVLITTASTNATTCKASAGNLYGYEFINTTATLAYVRLYNLAANPTCSSATGFIRSIPVPASATGAGLARDFTVPVNYTTGIAFCVTGGGSSTDNTNAVAGVYLNFIYK